MALTTEDLQAIAALLEVERENTRQIVQQELKPVKADIADIKEELADMHNGINAMVNWIEDIDNRKQDAV